MAQNSVLFCANFRSWHYRRIWTRSLSDDSVRSCFYRIRGTYRWCVSDQWIGVLHLWYAPISFSSPIQNSIKYISRVRKSIIYDMIWATSWENLFLPYENNKGADQSVQSRILISALVNRCLDSKIPLVSISKISRLASLCSWANRFESYLVKNPEDKLFRVSHTMGKPVFILQRCMIR